MRLGVDIGVGIGVPVLVTLVWWVTSTKVSPNLRTTRSVARKWTTGS